MKLLTYTHFVHIRNNFRRHCSFRSLCALAYAHAAPVPAAAVRFAIPPGPPPIYTLYTTPSQATIAAQDQKQQQREDAPVHGPTSGPRTTIGQRFPHACYAPTTQRPLRPPSAKPGGGRRRTTARLASTTHQPTDSCTYYYLSTVPVSRQSPLPPHHILHAVYAVLPPCSSLTASYSPHPPRSASAAWVTCAGSGTPGWASPPHARYSNGADA